MACWSNGKGKFCSGFTLLLSKGLNGSGLLVPGSWFLVFGHSSLVDGNCALLITGQRPETSNLIKPLEAQPELVFQLPPCKGQLLVEGVDLRLLQPVDFIDVVLHDLQQAWVAEAVQTVAG